MFITYLKNASKIFKRQPLYSIISIIALSLGLSSLIIVFIWITNEKSFDTFNQHHKSTYRVVLKGQVDDISINSAQTGAPLAKSLVNNFPEVKNATRVFKVGKVDALFQEKQAPGINVFGVDSSFFELFTTVFFTRRRAMCAFESK